MSGSPIAGKKETMGKVKEGVGHMYGTVGREEPKREPHPWGERRPARSHQDDGGDQGSGRDGSLGTLLKLDLHKPEERPC